MENVSKTKSYKLGEICEIVKGISLSRKDCKKEGVPVLKVKNIQNNQVKAEDLAYCNPCDFPKAIFANPGDLLITNGGSAGKVGINSSDKSYLFTADIFKLEPNPEILNKRYLYHFLLNSSKEIEKLVTSGIIPHLYKSSIEKLEIAVPSLKDQEKIAYKLDRFMELKEELKLRKKQHNYYRQQIINHLSERIPT